MKKHPAFYLGGFVLAACALLTLFVSCSKPATSKLSDGIALDRAAVMATLTQEGVQFFNVSLSSFSYGEVNEVAIPTLVEEFRSSLFKDGIPVSDVTGATGYDARFQCTGFSDYFAGKMAARMMGELWHSSLKVNRPAVFVVWYHPDAQPPGMDHAINLMIVNGGRAVWIEPQTGRRVTLTASEKATARVRA